MDKLELDDFEFYHSIWFAVLVVILLSVFVFPNQEFESLDWKIIKDNPILTSSTTNLICFFLIATIGVSHGSLDNYKGKKLLKFYSLKNSIIFYLSYIFVAFFIILLWKIFPALTLLIFLIIAAYHFGKEDSLKETRQSDLKFFYYFSRGSIIIFAPLAFHADETIEIFKMISNNLFVDYILNLEKFYFSKFMLSLVLLSSYLISGRRSASFYFEVPSILAINYFFTPFFACSNIKPIRYCACAFPFKAALLILNTISSFVIFFGGDCLIRFLMELLFAFGCCVSSSLLYFCS